MLASPTLFKINKNKMKIIKISKKEYGYFKNLIKEHDKIYGDIETTKWGIEDLEELRKIGKEFIDFFRKHL